MYGDVAKATSPCQKQYNDEKISNIDTQKELPYGSSLQVYGVYGFERILGNVVVAISRSSS